MEKNHPESTRTVNAYINAALSKVTKQLTTDLRQLIGFEKATTFVSPEADTEETITPETADAVVESSPDTEDESLDTPTELEIPEELKTEPLDIPPPSLDTDEDDSLQPVDEELLQETEALELDAGPELIIEPPTEPTSFEPEPPPATPEPSPTIGPVTASSLDERDIPPIPELDEIELPPPSSSRTTRSMG